MQALMPLDEHSNPMPRSILAGTAVIAWILGGTALVLFAWAATLDAAGR